METVPAIIAALVGAGGLGALLQRLYNARSKSKREDTQTEQEAKEAEQRRRESDQTFQAQQYRQLIDNLQDHIKKSQKQLDKLKTEIDGLRDEHIQCLTQNAALSARVKVLEDKLAELERTSGCEDKT